MGRNADKRRARRLAQQAQSSADESHDANSVISAEIAVASVASVASVVAVAAPTPDLSQVERPKHDEHVPEAVPFWRTRLLDIDEPRHTQESEQARRSERIDEAGLAPLLFSMTCRLALGSSLRSIYPALDALAREMTTLVDAYGICILLADDGLGTPPPMLLTGAYRMATGLRLGGSSIAINDNTDALLRFACGNDVAGHVVQTGEMVRIDDGPRDERFISHHSERTKIGSVAAIPLQYQQRRLGVLIAVRSEVRAFHERDFAFLGVVCASLAQDLAHMRMFIESSTDALTGLGSRIVLMTALPREVEAARRSRSDLSLVIFDLDGLNHLNERFGRRGGDVALVACGSRLEQELRVPDIPVRIGGDKFVALLPRTPLSLAELVAERLRASMRDAVAEATAQLPAQASAQLSAAEREAMNDENSPLYSVSAGVAAFALDDDDGMALLMRADQALQKAKKRGGNCTVCIDGTILGAALPR